MIEILVQFNKMIFNCENNKIKITKYTSKSKNIFGLLQYLIGINMLKNKQEIENWLNKMKIENFIINNDLTVDVDGDVDISDKKLIEIPVQFNEIKGWFSCSDNKILQSLKGCPQIGITYFWCNRCDLRDLKGAPKEIKGDFSCRSNKNLKSLKGCPQIGITYFICEKCDLENLEGAPKEIKGKFYCEDNKKLKSPKYAPKSKEYAWSKSTPESEYKLYEELINEIDYNETQEIWDDYIAVFAI